MSASEESSGSSDGFRAELGRVLEFIRADCERRLLRKGPREAPTKWEGQRARGVSTIRTPNPGCETIVYRSDCGPCVHGVSDAGPRTSRSPH